MSTDTTEYPESAAAAVTEAARITAQAARRGTETAKASIEVARSYMEETNGLSRDLFATLSTQGEAVLKAAFDAQTAALEAGLGMFDLGVKGNRQAIEQYGELLKRAQQASLESWQATVKANQKAVESTRR